MTFWTPKKKKKKETAAAKKLQMSAWGYLTALIVATAMKF